MQLYWLRQSVPELADVPKRARWRLHLNALRHSPGLVVAVVLLIACFYLASLVLTVLIVHDVIGFDQGLWVNLLVINGISFLVSFVPEWIIGRPILFHFLRPKYGMLREADEAQRRSTH